MKRIYQIALISAVLAAAGGAYAAKDAIKPKAQALAEAKISLVQAVDLAEKATKAKAVEVEFENDMQGASYEVKLLGGGKRLKVRVDADKGTVGAVQEKAEKAEKHEHDEQE
jgi:uncharacterized membrane protein YkoI